jgi:hypothetical protein
LHTLGAGHSAELVQVVTQPEVVQGYCPQLVPVTVRQLPPPSQVRAGVNTLVEHDAPAQTVPAAYLRQAPEPSQLPSVPQAAAPESAHCDSGSWPAGASLQLPRLPTRAHDRQVPLQLVAQQIPWAQIPEAHSVPCPQLSPLDFAPQVDPLHRWGLRHWDDEVHPVKQAPEAPHT